jgi:hypothetical protein
MITKAVLNKIDLFIKIGYLICYKIILEIYRKCLVIEGKYQNKIIIFLI